MKGYCYLAICLALSCIRLWRFGTEIFRIGEHQIFPPGWTMTVRDSQPLLRKKALSKAKNFTLTSKCTGDQANCAIMPA